MNYQAKKVDGVANCVQPMSRSTRWNKKGCENFAVETSISSRLHISGYKRIRLCVVLKSEIITNFD